MSVPDIAIFQVAMDKAKANIVALQSHKIVKFSDSVAEVSKDEPPFIDIIGKLMDKENEKVDKKDKGKKKKVIMIVKKELREE